MRARHVLRLPGASRADGSPGRRARARGGAYDGYGGRPRGSRTPGTRGTRGTPGPPDTAAGCAVGPARAEPGGEPRGGPRAGHRAVVRAAAVACGALWWWAALRPAVGPGPGAPWEGALLAGGWSLGLIPLHAVPTHGDRASPVPGRPHSAAGSAALRTPPHAGPLPQTAPGQPGWRAEPGEARPAPGGGSPGAGPRWQRGHQ
jgi:hypothetical protein